MQNNPLSIENATVHRVLMTADEWLWLCFDPYNHSIKEAIKAAKPAQVLFLNSCFSGEKADELLANLKLELSALGIGLVVV